MCSACFFCNGPPATQIYTLPLHDALPISSTASSTARQKSHTATTARRLRGGRTRSEEHTSELQSLRHLVCRLLLGKKNILAPSCRKIAQTIGAPKLQVETYSGTHRKGTTE